VNENQQEILLSFPRGIPGFEECKTFKMIEEEDSCLANLIATENNEASFIIFQSQVFFPDYLPDVELAKEEAKILQITAEDTLEVWSMLTLCRSDMSKTTVNLRAPILINRRTGTAAQFILTDDRYSSRQPLFTGLETNDKKEVAQEGAVG
jgi:flagellar assembly factor FliW